MKKTSFALALLLTITGHRVSHAGDNNPRVGATQTLPVVSVSISVGNSATENKRVIYAPPPGWYVRSHRVVTAQKRGSVSYAVNTVPAGWAWRAEEQSSVEGKSNATATLTAYKVSAGGQASLVTTAGTSELQSNTSSHHLLVVDVSAHGMGMWKGESGVELTVMAELVYLGR